MRKSGRLSQEVASSFEKRAITCRFCTEGRNRSNPASPGALKCDIKKFFASIDHVILISILAERIVDRAILELLKKIIFSFDGGTAGKGLPLGNLTSQLLVNIHMNEFDQYVKQILKVKHYIRYADDFAILSSSKNELIEILQSIGVFLESKLTLTLHPQKVFINTFASGIDFLGWVHFPTHRVLRTSTKQRLLRRTEGLTSHSPAFMSYMGLLKHGNAQKLIEAMSFDRSGGRIHDLAKRQYFM